MRMRGGAIRVSKDDPAPKVRAGRPTAARAAKIEAEVRTAARKLFLEMGFEAASMDLVASAAGVSKGTLYSRYASKDALLLAVIEDLLEQLHRLASANNHSLPLELGERLKEYARRLVAVMGWDEYGQLLQLTQSASRTRPDLSWGWQEAAMARYISTLATDLERQGAATGLQAVPWHHLASMLIYSVTGWYRSETTSGRNNLGQFEDYCTVVVDAIMAMARNGQPRSKH